MDLEITLRMENWSDGDWSETKWRSSCSKHALEIKLVFGCFYVFDIANTEIHTWKELGKSRFDEILKL